MKPFLALGIIAAAANFSLSLSAQSTPDLYRDSAQSAAARAHDIVSK